MDRQSESVPGSDPGTGNTGFQPKNPRAGVRVGVVAVLLAALTAAHFLSPVHSIWIHDFLFKATYLPIVLAALWFGRRGGLTAGVITAAIYTVHIQWQLAGHHQHEQIGFWLELVLYLVIGGTVGWLSDMQRRAEDRLREVNLRIERSLASLREKTEALFVAETSLVQADRLKAAGELAAGVAHEVKNPLAGILGAAKILADPATEPEDRREFAAVLTKETGRLDGVISGLLDLARPAKTARGESRLAAELGLVRKLTAGAVEKKKVTVVTSSVPQTMSVAIAPDALRQVLLNLTLNALVAVAPESGTIAWVAERAGDRIHLRIIDNGAGVDPAVRDRIFEPFVSTGSGDRSTGLGLPIVARLLADVGGSIKLESTGSDGTTFVVALPPASGADSQTGKPETAA